MYHEQWGCLSCWLGEDKGCSGCVCAVGCSFPLARANRSGFKEIKWVPVPTGMAQRGFQGLLANSMSSMDFFTYGLRLMVLPCVTARWNPAGAHCGAGTFLCTRGTQESAPWMGWKGQWPWTCFSHSPQMFFDPPQTFVHAPKSRQSHWRKTSLRERPPTVAQIMCGFKQVLTWHFSKWNAGPAAGWLLLACNSSWSANNIICHGWWQGERRGMGKRWEKK